MKVLITGPQGSGKTTQAKLLAEKLQLPMISSGDIIRGLASTGTPTGGKLKEVLDQGHLADNALVGEIINDRVKQSDCEMGFVMDGYPRDLQQLNYFDPQFDKVFYLELSDTDAVKRLLKRGRVDDKPELIKERLRIYHQRTQSVLDYYQNLGILEKIDGSKSIDQIQQQIREKLGHD